MKKLFAVMCLCVFVGSMASAQYLVYDYKASIKHLAPTVMKVKFNNDIYNVDGTDDLITQTLETYSTTTDTLTGFLVVPECYSCYQDYTGAETSNGYYESYLYIKRSGDKTYKVWKFDAWTAAGMFNLGVGNYNIGNSPDGGSPYPTSYKKIKGAWMEVYFDFDQFPNDIRYLLDPMSDPQDLDYPRYLWQEVPVADLRAPLVVGGTNYGLQTYGFLGFSSEFGSFDMTGFGSVKGGTQYDLCDDPTRCFKVSAISGDIIGWDYHTSVCDDCYPAIWDVCTLMSIRSDDSRYTSTDEPEDYINDGSPNMNGVSHGTWSVKLNDKTTVEFNTAVEPFDQFTPFGDAAELLLIKKLNKTGTLASLLYSHPRPEGHFWLDFQSAE